MKIFITLFIIALSVGSFLIYKNQLNAKNSTNPLKSVKGISISTNPTTSPSNNSYLQDTINQIQQQAKNINLNQIASSSPQIQQVIQELQTLPQVPLNNAKSACVQICNKL